MKETGDRGRDQPISTPADGIEMADLTGRLVGLNGQAPKIVLILLANNRPFSKRQLRSLTGMAYRTISHSLEQLAEDGAVSEVGNQGWRISEAWRGRFRAYLLGEYSDRRDHSGDRSDQPGGRFDQSGDRSDQPGGRFDQPGDRVDHSLTTVVVEDRFKKKNKDNQQQQSFRTPDSVTAEISPLKEPTGQIGHSGDRRDHSGDPRDHSTGHLDHSGDRRDHSGDLPEDRLGQDVDRSEELAAHLRQVGIVGKPFKNLLARPELILDPAPVLGWWWYGLTQENVRSPTALAANYLLAGNPAPAGFVELARRWPKVTEEKRLAVEEMVLANWPAGRLVDYWSEEFPEVTARTFIALKELYVRSRTSDAGGVGVIRMTFIHRNDLYSSE